jgi:putative tryptophan/tyrosine transport system substrate-binding protein
VKRRSFIAGLGSAAASPLAARAQQRAMPVIGYLDAGSLETRRGNVAAVHRGLSESGYVEGRNLAVEYRWAEDHLDRLPALADDLVRRQVAVIVVMSIPGALAAKPRRNQFQSFLHSAPTRLRVAWSPASIVRAAISRA